MPPAPFSVLTRRPPCRQRGRGGREPRSSRFSSQRLARRRPAPRICRTDVSPDSPDSPDCQIAQKRKVRWTWICQSSESDESVKRAFRPGLSLKYLTSIASPLYYPCAADSHEKRVLAPATFHETLDFIERQTPLGFFRDVQNTALRRRGKKDAAAPRSP